MKVLCLGNEFLEEDSLAKNISEDLERESGMDIINIKDSFQFLEELRKDDELILIDVVKGLGNTRLLGINDLSENNILTAHDFDAGFILKLIKRPVKIIGIPQKGDPDKIKEEVKGFLS